MNPEQDLHGGGWAVPTKDSDEVSVLLWRHDDVITDGPVQLNVTEPVHEDTGANEQYCKAARFLKPRYGSASDRCYEEHAYGRKRPLTRGRLAKALGWHPRGGEIRGRGHTQGYLQPKDIKLSGELLGLQRSLQADAERRTRRVHCNAVRKHSGTLSSGGREHAGVAGDRTPLIPRRSPDTWG